MKEQKYKKEWMRICDDCVDLEDIETEEVYLTVGIACTRNGIVMDFFDEIEYRPLSCPERWKKK